MIEQRFQYSVTGDKTMEQVIKEERLHINHMVLPKGEAFPQHVANATVFMTVLRGQLSINLGIKARTNTGGATCSKSRRVP